MKKISLLFILLVSLNAFSQRNGMSYQALLLNPLGEELPGVNNDRAPLLNHTVCLQFSIYNHNDQLEYIETMMATTNAYGMVNVVIGTGTQTGGSSTTWNDIPWSAEAMQLVVDLDVKADCANYEEISNQPLTSVPFALYSPASEIPGPEGPAGATGATGAQGIQGDTGATGLTGTDGAVGAQGIQGDAGAIGASAYQTWLDLGNTGSEQEFINSLTGPVGTNGTTGDSAYQTWLDLGNTGSEQEFINSLTGPAGEQGENGLKTITNLIDEIPGGNCLNGGVKIEIGSDVNDNGILDDSEIDDSLTRYICNGEDGQDGVNTNNSGGSNMFFNSVTEALTPIPIDSCDDPINHSFSNYIASEGSWWTRDVAIGWDNCYSSPNGLWWNGCEPGYTNIRPEHCRLEITSPVPSQLIHNYNNLNASKIELEVGVTALGKCFGTNITLEFYDASGNLIPSFLEEVIEVNGGTGIPLTNYYSASTSQTITHIGSRYINTGYTRINRIYHLPHVASELKIIFEAQGPGPFIIGQCTESSYSNRTSYDNYSYPASNYFTPVRYSIIKWQ